VSSCLVDDFQAAMPAMDTLQAGGIATEVMEADGQDNLQGRHKSPRL